MVNFIQSYLVLRALLEFVTQAKCNQVLNWFSGAVLFQLAVHKKPAGCNIPDVVFKATSYHCVK